VGIATQDPELRSRFTGKPEHVIQFFHFLANDLREIMAELGFRTINEMVGKVEMLKLKKDIHHWKYKHLDLSPILYKEPADESVGQYKKVQQDHGISGVLDHTLIKTALPALENKQVVKADFKIRNIDRATGTMLSYEISKKYKGDGLPEGTIQYTFNGSAGQSFGAFAAKGIHFRLEGEANDYFGKGLSGGRLIVVPDSQAKFIARDNIIIGNVAFYGATSGEAYILGCAGERFAVRNSGVTTVVEGIGDHGCEYMTGGVVVVLGETGENFAAGMSGGVAYVYDKDGTFSPRLNREMVELELLEEDDFIMLNQLVLNHYHYTHSPFAGVLLDHWAIEKNNFRKVMPADFKQVLLKRNKKLQLLVTPVSAG
jgi:glutamate synthase (NADPH/NADH) large chain